MIQYISHPCNSLPTVLDTPQGVAWGPALPTPGGSQHPKGPKESHPPAIEHYPCKHAHVRHFLTHCHISITHVSPLQLPTRSSLERRRHTAIEQKRVYEWSPLSNGRPFPRSPGTTCRGTSATQRARRTATTALKTLHSNRGPGTPPTVAKVHSNPRRRTPTE